MRPIKDATAPCSLATMLMSGLSTACFPDRAMESVLSWPDVPDFHARTVARDQHETVTASDRPLGERRNAKNVKDFSRSCCNEWTVSGQACAQMRADEVSCAWIVTLLGQLGSG